MQTHSITLGRNIPNSGTVTNQMWIQFLQDEVCTSLEYATVTEGTGIYKGELEQCMIISVQTDDANVIKALHAVGSRYKKQFNQDCILYSTTDNPQFALTWPNQNPKRKGPSSAKRLRPYSPSFTYSSTVKNYYKCVDLNRWYFIIKVYKTGINSMFNKDLTPMYDGRVLMNKTAMQDPVVRATLDAMAKRNFEPQRLNAYGVWYISDRH